LDGKDKRLSPQKPSFEQNLFSDVTFFSLFVEESEHFYKNSVQLQ